MLRFLVNINHLAIEILQREEKIIRYKKIQEGNLTEFIQVQRWNDKVSNERLLTIANVKRELLQTIKKRKITFLGQILCGEKA